ncbi:MAG: tyrosine-type recombinase/integrase [Rhizobiales bacterium]|nr:tyrosine-type recombinase/integrase [Hyphomicrobiales bacterium]
MIYATDGDVATLNAPGKYSFGGGLYLQVQGPKAKSWLYRYTLRGKQRWMGLGSAAKLTVKNATRKRDGCRAQVEDGGIDLVEQSKSTRAAKIYRPTGAVTFRDAAAACIENKRSMWRNAKHAAQWESSLENYAYPIIGDMSVAAVEREHVVNVLNQPDKKTGRAIWLSKRETANRLRGRIEDVLVFSMANKWRPASDSNPAQLTKLLRAQLPSRPKKREKHHAALPHSQIAAFLSDLQKRSGLTPRALRFTILTAVRTSETIKARWDEFDLNARIWSIPADRMKMENEHKVALSGAAMAVLEEMQQQRESDYVFAGFKHEQPLSDMAMLTLARKLAYGHVTTHGFRSSFKDYCREELGEAECPDWLSEAILAHKSGDKILRAYARGTEAQMRLKRKVMEAWAAYCSPAPTGDSATAGNVLSLHTGRGL